MYWQSWSRCVWTGVVVSDEVSKDSPSTAARRTEKNLEITIMGERVSSLVRAQEILEEARIKKNSEGIARSLYAITQIAPGTPAAVAAAAEIEVRWERSREDARRRTSGPPVAVLPKDKDAAEELEARWERSRAEARTRTAAMAQTGQPYDPYASQRHRRGPKSHLAAAINQNIHDNPLMGCVWFVVFFVSIVGSMIMVVAGK